MSVLAGAGKYWHTIRHLKPVQVYGRFAFRLLRPRVDTAPAPAPAAALGRWVEPARRAPSMTGPGSFSFLGTQARLQDIGWDNPRLEKLWRYNQHYFDDLNAEGGASRAAWHAALIAQWVADNAPGTGTAWEPYPTSLRIVNWVKWMCAGNPLPPAALHSLAVQTRWLTGRLERHLLGNHLFANAKALVFAGLAFEGAEAGKWLALGLRIIARELPEQVLADGGNFERSPMYHAIFLEDMLDLVNVAGARPGRIDAGVVRDWEQTAVRMLGWLRGMSHPDGGIALFNDAALGIAPDHAGLEAYARRLQLALPVAAGAPLPACQAWPESGYVRLEAAEAVALLDVGPVGPDYLPGHAHADTLSFELSLFRQRVIVNGGTSRYGLGPERERERATCSHSTVEVDGQSSSEVWSGFRVARRAYPFGYAARCADGEVEVACSHDGYRRLPGKPVHRRSWTLRNGRLEIADLVSGGFMRAKARYILHPDVAVEAGEGQSFVLKLAGGQRCVFEVAAGRASLEPARYGPVFGPVQDTMCIAVELDDKAATITINWI
ncbi:heparinase II/III family protein [Massilia sp. ZL223]|uniref:heparinase II/III family protein n=1 Tax=Massilia sp. ZL223 TaxID=2824904 RepID=UPI001B827A8C|nr:heparinase II/III family protein [Massilia sp. ZL223]MBQ5963364.1 alginate lyase family protein [Massilia sp. ZL223]